MTPDEPFRTLTPDELYAMLRMSDDPTQTLIGLIRGIDYPANLGRYKKDAAWEAARGAAWAAATVAARDAARDAAWDAARDAALLAGCMVVSDIIDRKHLNFALAQMCWWIRHGEELSCPR